MPMSVRRTDRLLCHYVHKLYVQGGRSKSLRAKATQAVYGVVMDRPRLRGKLVESERALVGWARRHPSESQPPMSWNMTCLLATKLFGQGHWEVAAAAILSHDCILRPMDIVRLRVSRVSPRTGTAGASALSLWNTKTQRYEWVALKRPEAEVVLKLALERARRLGRSSLLGLSYTRYYRRFKAGVAALGFPEFKPYSVRHGAVTAASLDQNMTYMDIAIRGRWKSMKSCRTYVQSGRALMLENKRPDRVKELAAKAARLLCRVARATVFR